MNKKVLYGGIGGIGCLGLLILIVVGVGGWYALNQKRIENERYAISGLQNIAEAQNNFFFKKLNFKYANLEELKAAGLLNSYGDWLQDGSHGYQARIVINGVNWYAIAEPKSYSIFNGHQSFIVSSDTKVHGRQGAGATLDDPPASAY